MRDMTEIKTDHFREAESYLLKLDDLGPTDAYVAVIAAQAHATLAQGAAAAEMVGLQKLLLTSMQPPVGEQSAPADDVADENDEPVEPRDFGSVVKVTYRNGRGEVRWCRTFSVLVDEPWCTGNHMGSWAEVVEEASDVEVLRVGIG
jgi:hypothetical protein